MVTRLVRMGKKNDFFYCILPTICTMNPPNVDRINVVVAKTSSRSNPLIQQVTECKSKEEFDNYFHGYVVYNMTIQVLDMDDDGSYEYDHTVISMKNARWIDNRVPVDIMCENDSQNSLISVDYEKPNAQIIIFFGTSEVPNDFQHFSSFHEMPPSDPQP